LNSASAEPLPTAGIRSEGVPVRLSSAAARWPGALPIVVLIVVLVVTGVLAAVSQSVYTRNENRLLHLRVNEAGSILGATLPDIQATMASGAELAEATNGDVAKFRRFLTPYVGPARTDLFVSASL
jgi:CHASE1-domain containing sensor protein